MEKIIKDRSFLLNRRNFLSKTSIGIGTAALSSLLGMKFFRQSEHGIISPTNDGIKGILKDFHFAPKAKRVIYLFQSGGPSQYELFDYKPLLNERRGEDLPASIRDGQRLTGMTSVSYTHLTLPTKA